MRQLATHGVECVARGLFECQRPKDGGGGYARIVLDLQRAIKLVCNFNNVRGIARIERHYC